jgi:hypothetical protein
MRPAIFNVYTDICAVYCILVCVLLVYLKHTKSVMWCIATIVTYVLLHFQIC